MNNKRDAQLKNYLDMLALGDSLDEYDKRRVIRKTTTVIRDNKTGETVTTYEKEEIDFS